ncbi:hypothetical protein RJ55_00191 [Drechmeria coniospora]|nr:hypothetical protein RJ55_00191 [Drechmeria coniospora]
MLRQALSSSSRALRSGPRQAIVSRPLAIPRRQCQTAIPWRPTPCEAVRWYSEAKEAPAEPAKNGKDGKETSGGNGETDALAELKKALEAKDNEAKEWKDKCLRTVADFRNLQDRTQREVKTARDFAIQKFAKDLVDSVDNLDRALTTVPADRLTASADQPSSAHLQDLVNLYEGIKMTENILVQTLAKHGLERLDPHGDKFNPNEHEATFMAPQPEKENNTVFHVQQKGFKLNGRVLRAAKVGVVKNS